MKFLSIGLFFLISSQVEAKYCHRPHTPIPTPVNCTNEERVVNGDFEDDIVPSNNWGLLSELNGWDVDWTSKLACGLNNKELGLAELQSFTSEQLPDSLQYIELDSDCLNSGLKHNNIRIEQKIPAQVGEIIKFKFSYKPRRLEQGLMQLKVRFGKRTWTFNQFSNTDWQHFEQNLLVRHQDLNHQGMIDIVFKDEGAQDSFGMFVDNVSARATNCQQPVPNCSNAASVVSYNPVGNFATNRKNPAKALGLPNGEPYSEPNVGFVSLGFGGSIVLKLDYPVKNVIGKDLRIWETTGDNNTYAQYKEEADVYGSLDGVSWTLLGRVKNDNNAPTLGEVELGSMNEALYIKIVDKSPVVSGRDGFDLDAITCVNQNNEWDSRVFYLDKTAQKIFKVKVSGDSVYLKQFVSNPYNSAHIGFDADNLYIVEANGQNRISILDILSNTWSANHDISLQSHITQVAVNGDNVFVNKSNTNEIVQYNTSTDSLINNGKVFYNHQLVKLLGGDLAFSFDNELYLATQQHGGRLYRLNQVCASSYNATLIASNLGKVSGLAQLQDGSMLVSILNSKQMKKVNIYTGQVSNLTLKGDLTKQGSGADLAN